MNLLVREGAGRELHSPIPNSATLSLHKRNSPHSLLSSGHTCLVLSHLEMQWKWNACYPSGEREVTVGIKSSRREGVSYRLGSPIYKARIR